MQHIIFMIKDINNIVKNDIIMEVYTKYKILYPLYEIKKLKLILLIVFHHGVFCILQLARIPKFENLWFKTFI